MLQMYQRIVIKIIIIIIIIIIGKAVLLDPQPSLEESVRLIASGFTLSIPKQ
jgi:hypothetical protein